MKVCVGGSRFWGILGLLAMAGCSESGTPRETAPAASPPVLTEHRPQGNGTGLMALGEDCTQGSHSDCASGLCLHAAPGGAARAEAGYFCSRTCQKPTDCPTDWRCQQLLPTTPERLCVPPSTWKAAAAAPRAPEINR
ncbi:hypothetical protein KH5H1_49300 [Corallococcus caeni]|nr:hypothetical protein KH5H1_49300 [Corallococcus sp. KH5-1]